jgi:hypothetical protein
MDDRLILHVADTATANQPSPFDHLEYIKAELAAADIMVRCAICEEHVSMNSNDYRAQGVFICEKCKAAIKHVRDYLEKGGSIT